MDLHCDGLSKNSSYALVARARMKALIKVLIPRHWRRKIRALRWRVEEIWGPSRGLQALRLYREFRKDFHTYRSLSGAEHIDSIDLWPCLFDKTGISPVPAHYFYQAAWAARRILQTGPLNHVDIGSQLDLVGILSAMIPITFVDIRPLVVPFSNVQSIAGSILALSLRENSINSLSCLSVIEHIGLGRYGDPFDPKGTERAAKELTRVLAPGGNLFLSTPVGRDRTCFNAHRVHSPKRILGYFEELTLVEFSCEDDSGKYRENIDLAVVEGSNNACGLFWFTKDR